MDLGLPKCILMQCEEEKKITLRIPGLGEPGGLPSMGSQRQTQLK